MNTTSKLEDPNFTSRGGIGGGGGGGGCGKVYFRLCMSHVIGAWTDPLSSYLKTSCWTCSTRFENIRSRVNNNFTQAE